MKVLTVTNMWPVPECQYFGIFVHEQVEGIKRYYPDTDIKVWFIKGFKYKINYILSIFRINWHLLFNKYDIIHIHFGLSGMFLPFRYYKNGRFILTLHGSDINLESSYKLKVWITKKLLKYVDQVICVNEEMAKKTNRPKNALVLPCAVNTDLFLPAEKPEIPTIQFVFAGTKKKPKKNYTLFKSIIAILKNTHHIEIQEIIIDKMSRDEVVATLQATDILLLTSFSEGSPQIVKEAMSCNIPVISTNVGDVANLLDNVSNSYVVNSFTPDDFIEPILKILNKKKKDRISNGRTRLMELNLDTEKTTHKLMTIYANLLNEKSF